MPEIPDNMRDAWIEYVLNRGLKCTPLTESDVDWFRIYYADKAVNCKEYSELIKRLKRSLK